MLYVLSNNWVKMTNSMMQVEGIAHQPKNF